MPLHGKQRVQVLTEGGSVKQGCSIFLQYSLPFLGSNSNHNDGSLLQGGLFTCNSYKL